MEFKKTTLDGVWLIAPDIRRDSRGYFYESFSGRELSNHGMNRPFVQDNHTLSTETGVLRGLHFQLPPSAQAKLVRVIAGRVLDVVVDLRTDSPTFGKWESFDLSADNFLQLYIPRGFAHGFMTMEPHTQFLYKVDQYYDSAADRGIIWNDPTLAIAWPIRNPILSDRDKKHPHFKDVTSPFTMKDS